MIGEDDVILNSRAYKYFDKNLLKDKDLRDTLVSFEEVLSIKKNIRSMYNTDDSEKVKFLIGKNVNGVEVKEKDYEYVLLISNTYKNLYDKCKKLLEEKKQNEIH